VDTKWILVIAAAVGILALALFSAPAPEKPTVVVRTDAVVVSASATAVEVDARSPGKAPTTPAASSTSQTQSEPLRYLAYAVGGVFLALALKYVAKKFALTGLKMVAVTILGSGGLGAAITAAFRDRGVSMVLSNPFTAVAGLGIVSLAAYLVYQVAIKKR
jgi:hypothetical protein